MVDFISQSKRFVVFIDEAIVTSVMCSVIFSPTIFGCAGVLYRDAGNISLAVEAYEQCLKIDPDSRNAGQV